MTTYRGATTPTAGSTLSGYNVDTFTGDGSDKTFTLTGTMATSTNIWVYFDGVHQANSSYSIANSIITFVTAPLDGSDIQVKYGEVLDIGSPSAGTVDAAKLSASTTDLVAMTAKLLYDQGGTGSVARTVESRLQDSVSVKDYGALGDGTADDTAAIQAATDAVYTAGGGTVWFPTPSSYYRITDTITIPVKVNWEGASPDTWIHADTGTYSSGYVFLWNTTTGNDAVVTLPNLQMGSIKNFKISSVNVNYKAFAVNGSAEFEHIRFEFFLQGIYGSTLYNDIFKIINCHFVQSSVGSSYLIELGATGDGVVIENCHFPNVGATPDTPLNSVKITHNLAEIRNSLLGNVLLIDCGAGVTIANSGTDGGQFLIEQSNVKIIDCALSILESDVAIKLVNTTGLPYTCILDNVAISHDVERDTYEPFGYDIKTANNYNITIKDCTRRILLSSAPASRYQFGVLLSNEASASLDTFNNYSYIYSKDCKIANEVVVGGDFSLTAPTSSFNSLTAIFSSSAAVWDSSTTTYYYKAILLWDKTRLAGRVDAASEVSRAATNTGDATGLSLSISGYPTSRRIRVYRGTSTGSYDKYVDLNIIDTPTLIDTGNQLSGHDWLSRGAAGVDTYNNYTAAGINFKNNLFTWYTAGAPTAGTWLRGDTIIDSTPSAGGYIGWICVTAGSPGTWKTFGAITS